MINSYDIDGVCYISPEFDGIYPGPKDVIITGRSLEEAPETIVMLRKRGIWNEIYYNPLPFVQKTRVSSGEHKARILNLLHSQGTLIGCHFEDDEVQIEVINRLCPRVHVVHLVHDLTNKENVRHVDRS